VTVPTRPRAPATPPPPSWPGLLQRLSAEALSLAGLTARIEHALAEAMPVTPGLGEISEDIAHRTGAVVQDLQELDRLRQTLEDMGQLMLALSVQAPATALDPLPLSTALTLRTLAGRLLMGEDRHQSGESGDCEGLTIL